MTSASSISSSLPISSSLSGSAAAAAAEDDAATTGGGRRRHFCAVFPLFALALAADRRAADRRAADRAAAGFFCLQILAPFFSYSSFTGCAAFRTR